MKWAIKELRKDFKDCVSEIDFKEYDPFGKQFMKASFIGEMWYLLKMLLDDDEVEEELEGAEKYMEKYRTTGDVAFRDMAKDELRHAGILIKKHYEWADDEKKATLEMHEEKRQELMRQLESESKE
ncbi:MAG: hypothetical protein J6S85_19700 [Methanobrevibacter sp.]|nr:hypothetical protein [Methanobrevibacter sp.]